jgi:hypothetical protein
MDAFGHPFFAGVNGKLISLWLEIPNPECI